jgi:uncharacterized iron-regulated protein
MMITAAVSAVIISGCAATPKKLLIRDTSRSYPAGRIISGKTGAPVLPEALLADLARVRIVYVGENHHNPAHHKIQLRIIKAMHKMHPDLIIGMEMFDKTYQPVLNQWSADTLDEKAFLQKVHWYVNWRFNFDLYRDILDFARVHRVRIIGLNIPAHIPPKIAAGGIDSLLDDDRRYLPADIDTSSPAHRAYLQKIFKFHHLPGPGAFENFYMAQCVWEDTMAESIALNLGRHPMVVIAGNGHIRNKFGIPDRAYKRTRAPFRTISLIPAGGRADLSFADYIWVTPPDAKQPRHGH